MESAPLVKQERYLVSRPVAPKDKFVKKGNAKLAPPGQHLVRACVALLDMLALMELAHNVRRMNSPALVGGAAKLSRRVVSPLRTSNWVDVYNVIPTKLAATKSAVIAKHSFVILINLNVNPAA